jgi:nucleoside-diphosphate-sugar epimerase
MKILITGDAGFVGTHFQIALANHDVTGVDVLNGYDARDFFKRDTTRFDLVIHLAAIVGGRLTIENSPLTVATDLSIDSDMFQWALKTKPRRVVYFSSSAAYPIHKQKLKDRHSLTEDDIDLQDTRSPDLTYGWAKLTGEILASHAENEGLRVHVFRPFSGYGSDQSLDYPFPSFIQRAIQKADPFTVWGNGNQARDFIHIDDVVNGALEAVYQDVDGPINLGTGRATTFNELAEIACAEASYYPKIEHVLSAPTGVEYRVSDSRKLLSFYEPKVSLEEGIQRAIKDNS